MPILKSTTLAAMLMAGTFALAAPAMAQDYQPETGTTEIADSVPETLASGIIVTDATGNIYGVRFLTSGAYETTSGSAGGWTMEGQTLCLADTQGATMCTSVPEDATAGTTWSETDEQGNTMSFAIPTDQETPDGEGSAE